MPPPAIPRPTPSGASAPIGPRPAAADLLAWYDRHRRTLPWRAATGETADPYRVWLSEIMLQQTTVGAVIPYFQRFLAHFPDIGTLAAADEEAVLRAWAGLGYYARARNLHACARALASAGGTLPRDPAALRALPGIGAYTATAIAAIAFDLPGVPVDGNVERVAARVFAITGALPAARPAIARAAAALGADAGAVARPADFAQALFDLGATICTPAAPACALCPWRAACAGHRAGIAGELPRKAPKLARPVRHGAAFWLTDASGRVLLRRRPSRGLLGGMTELPGTPWRPERWTESDVRALGPMPGADWRAVGEIRHVFTHFELRLALHAATVERIDGAGAGGFLRDVAALGDEALPSLMRKCVSLAITPADRAGKR